MSKSLDSVTILSSPALHMTTTQMIGIMMIIRETHMLIMPKIIDFDFLVGFSLFNSDCWIINSDCKLSECTFLESKE